MWKQTKTHQLFWYHRAFPSPFPKDFSQLFLSLQNFLLQLSHGQSLQTWVQDSYEWRCYLPWYLSGRSLLNADMLKLPEVLRNNVLQLLRQKLQYLLSCRIARQKHIALWLYSSLSLALFILATLLLLIQNLLISQCFYGQVPSNEWLLRSKLLLKAF